MIVRDCLGGPLWLQVVVVAYVRRVVSKPGESAKQSEAKNLGKLNLLCSILNLMVQSRYKALVLPESIPCVPQRIGWLEPVGLV
jgi:hypothetical protein